MPLETDYLIEAAIIGDDKGVEGELQFGLCLPSILQQIEQL